MLIHPQFDPIAFSLGPVAVRWYGLMYLIAFLAFFVLGRLRLRDPAHVRASGLDARTLVAHRLADEHGMAFCLAQRPAGLVQHLAQYTVGDGFTVDQHTVTVEQHGTEHAAAQCTW